MKMHINNALVCETGSGVLWNISEGDCSNQREVCEKGGLTVLVEMLKKHDNNISVLDASCAAIGMILSSQEINLKFCTQDVLSTVKECYEKHKESEQIKEFLFGITRENDPRVVSDVSRNLCTKESFKKCSDDCRCDENVYCPKCCIQQKAFVCHTCDQGEIKFYCETCWKRDHQGHECEEFFCPVRCATNKL